MRGRRAGAERGTDSLPGTDGDGAAPLFKASTGHWQPTFSQPASLAVCFSPSPSSERYVQGEGSADVLGGGGLVWLCPRGGMQRAGTALSRGDAVASSPRQGGCHSPSVVAPKGAGLCLQPRQSLPGGSQAVGADRDPSCMGSILNPQHLSERAAVKPLHPLYIGCSY